MIVMIDDSIFSLFSIFFSYKGPYHIGISREKGRARLLRFDPHERGAHRLKDFFPAEKGGPSLRDNGVKWMGIDQVFSSPEWMLYFPCCKA